MSTEEIKFNELSVTSDDQNVNVTADATVRYEQANSLTYDQTIRIHSIQAALSISLNDVIPRARVFELYIRDGWDG